MKLKLEKLARQKANPLNKANNDWLDKVYRKSKSERSKSVAKISLKCFDLFCKDQGMDRHTDPDVQFGYIPKMIEQFNAWYNPKPNPEILVRADIDSICKTLDLFVAFMDEDREDIVLSVNVKKGTETTFKKKSHSTIKNYFGFTKSYIRQVHGIKISSEDINDFVTFPEELKYQREALTLKQLKAIMSNAGAQRRALYYVLISSGMRLGEALTLTKKNIHMDENPVRITLEPENTKTNEGRETYISSEAVEKLKPILEKVTDDDLTFFMPEKSHDYNVIREDRIFGYLREKLGMTEKYGKSGRYKVRIHAFRNYFHTKASQKHSTEYANALDGHTGYLQSYYNLTPERRAEMYRELEPELLIESVKIHNDEVKDKEFAQMKEDMIALKEELERQKKYNIIAHA